MKNKGKKRTDIKYIAVLFVLIMIFSSIGILFGNVQIGNSNTNNFTPASNPAGTLELSVEIGGTFLYYNLYSNGSIYIAPSGLLNDAYGMYFNLTYQGVFYTNLYYTYNTGTQISNNLADSMWLTNGTASAGYNLVVHATPTPLIPISEYSNVYTRTLYATAGFFDNNPGGFTSNQQFVFDLGEAVGSTGSGALNTYVPINVNFYYLQNEVGQTTTLTATASGGTSPYTYQWYQNGIAVSGATSSTYSYSASSVSQANFICKITDSTGAVQWSEPTFIMTNPHTTVSLSGQQRAGGTNEADVNQAITFTGDFSYNPYGISKNGIFTGSTQFASGTTNAVSGSTSFASSGSYTIEFYAVDANGYNATTTISYTIYADPILSALSTQNSIHTYNNIKTTDVNVPIYIIGNASLGSGGFSYSWSVQSINSNTLTYTPTAVSSGIVITLTLTDSNGWVVSASITIIVNTDMTIVITTTTTGQ